jgi:hypothetical protein
MAAPTYSTDLTLIGDAQDVATFVATGGGASALNDETDYFINNTQCVSKNGFTATQKGLMHDDVSAPTITAGDAVFIWARQANRNILQTVANSGGSVIMGTSNTVYDGFNVDGSNVAGSNLLSWVSYAVDPTATPSYSNGTPGAYDHFGFEWTILGSGSLKGAPNAVGVIRHGRELRMVDGDVGNGFATFDGAATFDANVARRWGILTPVTGGYLFHGDFVMGQSGTSTDFRDSDRSILVLEDAFVPSTFNEFEIINASSNVEWTNIKIEALGSTAPFILTLNVGTFTGELCTFVGGATTVFTSTGACTNSTWQNCGQITLGEADISGSSILTPTVAADLGAVFDDRTTTTTTALTEYTGCTFSIGSNAHHAIEFGTGVDDDLTLEGVEFTGFSSTNDANNSTLRFNATSGSLTLTLINCTVDGAAATTSNVGVDDAAGITVTLSTDIVGTFTGMRDNTEVRVYAAGTSTELAGIENATAGSVDNRSFAATIAGGTSVDYVIHNVDYEYIRVEGFTWPSAAQDIPIQQRLDRNFDNP